mmetsp:Transcript_32620/g.75038  ORF Transcript_32620/g.75038 Transcript_32620/m.75038 type:complete len:469 (-) Transcript_32620:492-1898(-)|eukprot:CAMPEP_0116832882 /NCGR_PEP_ID=MMETSP0418-20121206/6132_1 /TAXON_ID=1158023 /ORGANISM="Astrosyne radiata, Strain 13vi08-1A" /LENGTH=468 /DNA_ID=CAMNT_0004462279 /DNA_START=1445 /DNA_END=2851 /DNA_ORIENTATION=+
MKGDVLTMTSNSDLQTAMNGSQESRRDVDDGFAVHRASHSGLSALLSAVTLQLSESASNEDSKTDQEPVASHAEPMSMTQDEDDNANNNSSSRVTQTTPPMMPEAHAAPTTRSFPLTLMTLLMDPDNDNTITFLPDDKYFALRSDIFSSTLMSQHFSINEWEAFLQALANWGFVRIETRFHNIEVFRHPMFRKGDWKQVEKMTQGESAESKPQPPPPSSDDPSSLPEVSLSTSVSESFKRRLSPAHAEKATPSTAKVRIHTEEDEVCAPDSRPSSAGRRRKLSDDDCRHLAVTITTEKLKLEQTKHEDANKSMPLESQAVFGATHTIVTDAIETLLRDEDHTRKTFQKHADELSKSSLPGLVPISKQLFCSSAETREAPSTMTPASGNNPQQRQRQAESARVAALKQQPHERSQGAALRQKQQQEEDQVVVVPSSLTKTTAAPKAMGSYLGGNDAATESSRAPAASRS